MYVWAKVRGWIETETPTSIGIGPYKVFWWFPKRFVRRIRYEDGESSEYLKPRVLAVEIPDWLAKKKGLEVEK